MDTLSIRPNNPRPAPNLDGENTYLEEERLQTITEKQQQFALRAGKRPKTWSPNPNMRMINKSRGNDGSSTNIQSKNFTAVYGMAVFWDIAGFLVGLVPIVGWVINFCIIVPAAVFNLYIMCIRRGVTDAEFWKAFKFIFGEMIPYINIIPFYTRSIYLIQHPKINKIIHSGTPYA